MDIRRNRMFGGWKHRWRKRVVPLLLVLLAGCSAEHYVQSADRETYQVISEKETAVLGAPTGFKLEPELPKAIPMLPPAPAPAEEEASGVEAPPPGAKVLSLNEAQRTATQHSREYLGQKEDLYLSALAATLERHRWSARLDGGISANVVRSGKEDRYGTADLGLGVVKKLAQGGEISADLALELTEAFEGDVDDSYLSSLSLRLRQPLLRGAGKLVAQEALVQAERDVIYAVRRFVRFRQTFFVDIADSYYRVLEQRQVVENEWRNYQNLKDDRARQEDLQKAGRLRKIEVDQARQRELQGRNRWVLARENYELALDQFKIALGLPTDANVALDPAELDRLSEAGLMPVEVGLDDAIRLALSERLDLKITYDQLEDVERRLTVARNNLGWDLDLELLMQAASRPRHNISQLQFDEGTYSAGLTLDFPLDRKAERNAYRQAVITVDRQERSVLLKEDNIKLEVRRSYRRLQQAMESYRIQQMSVQLAGKRAEDTSLMIQAGRAVTRDLLEAREALVEAENALADALVSYLIARLEFERDIGTPAPLDDGGGARRS
jgi:outer membrane protein TolC